MVEMVTNFVSLTLYKYSYLIVDGNESKKVKGPKRCVMKIKPKSEDCLEATRLDNKICQLGKN